jgi:hypothetical protein
LPINFWVLWITVNTLALSNWGAINR